MPYSLRDQPPTIEDIIVHLGHEFRSARHVLMDTQTALSERAGVSQSTWSMVEHGLAEGVRLETLARMVAALGYDLVLRRCDHPNGLSQEPTNGRAQRVVGATRIPGSRRLAPGPGWLPRDRW